MQLGINWGPRVGPLGTGTIQGLFEALEFTGADNVISQTVSTTSLQIYGRLGGQLMTLQYSGFGFVPVSSSQISDAGTITGISLYLGGSIAGSQNIMSLTTQFTVRDLVEIVEDEFLRGDISAIEDYLTSFDWTYNGLGSNDLFPEGTRSNDGVLLNLRGNDRINLGGGNDDFFSGDGNDTVLGAAGFDSISGGLGNDVLNGGDHADDLRGGDGNDNLIGGLGFDVLHGDAGNDTLDGGAAPDRLYGGTGNDLIRAGSNFGITVDGVFGGSGNDTLLGQAGYDLLNGGAGDDLLDGGNQADNLLGGFGDDTMRGGQGLDRLFGGQGNDIGFGGIGTDGMFGESGNDTLYGEAGNDRFFAGVGDDMAFGGADNDTIYGGAGFDTVDGGIGNDVLQGNFNADTFVFADGHGDDTVSDFDANNDLEKIDLSGITAITNFADLDGNHLSSVAGGVLIDTGSGNSIMLNGVTRGDLDMADFIF